MDCGTVNGLSAPVGRIVLGTGWFSPERMEDASGILEMFLSAGGTAVDTAHVYGNGASERAIGQWLRETGRRDDVVIVTKGAHPDLADWVPRVNAQRIGQDLNESLERLGVDTIDLYLLHRDDPGAPVGPIIDCLNEHVSAGRIRALGVSNWTHPRIDEANAYATAHGLQGFVASSPHLALPVSRNFAYPGVVLLADDEAALAWYRERQFPLLSWSSQASGFFAGRTPAHYDADDNRERLRRAQEIASRLGCSPTQVALAWVLHQPMNVFPLVGTSKRAHLEEALAALDVHLTPEDVAWLNLRES